MRGNVWRNAYRNSTLVQMMKSFSGRISIIQMFDIKIQNSIEIIDHYKNLLMKSAGWRVSLNLSKFKAIYNVHITMTVKHRYFWFWFCMSLKFSPSFKSKWWCIVNLSKSNVLKIATEVYIICLCWIWTLIFNVIQITLLTWSSFKISLSLKLLFFRR